MVSVLLTTFKDLFDSSQAVQVFRSGNPGVREHADEEIGKGSRRRGVLAERLDQDILDHSRLLYAA